MIKWKTLWKSLQDSGLLVKGVSKTIVGAGYVSKGSSIKDF